MDPSRDVAMQMPMQMPGQSPLPPELMGPAASTGGAAVAPPPALPGPPGQGAPPAQSAPPDQPEPKPSWAEVMEILRSDKIRSYRVDIETDQTAMEDAAMEEQRRSSFALVMKDLMAGVYSAATTAPATLPLLKEFTLYVMRSYKAGRAMEQSVEDVFDDLMANPPQDPNSGAKPPTISMNLKDMPPDAQTQAMAMAGIQTDPQSAVQHTALLNPSAPVAGPDPVALKKVDEVEKPKVGIEKQKADDDFVLRNRELDIREQEIAAQREQLARQAEIEDRNFGIQQQTAEREFGLKQGDQQFSQQAAKGDYALKAAGQNKAFLDEDLEAAATAEGPAEHPVMAAINMTQQQLMATSQDLSTMVQLLAQNIQQAAQALQTIQGEVQQVQASVQQVMAIEAAPSEIIRGPDGRAIAARKGNVTRPIVRGPDNRITGVGEANA